MKKFVKFVVVISIFSFFWIIFTQLQKEREANFAVTGYMELDSTREQREYEEEQALIQLRKCEDELYFASVNHYKISTIITDVYDMSSVEDLKDPEKRIIDSADLYTKNLEVAKNKLNELYYPIINYDGPYKLEVIRFWKAGMSFVTYNTAAIALEELIEAEVNLMTLLSEISCTQPNL